MVFHRLGEPLRLEERPEPQPHRHQVRVRVRACGACRTDVHLVDGELEQVRPPVVPGHQLVGVVEAVGDDVTHLRPGDRVGVAWLASTCGRCRHCQAGRENLCDAALFTGCSVDGGFAEQALADGRYCLRLPAAETLPDADAAPLLCAGLIGYRSLRMCGDDAAAIGLYGFGAAAHIVAQVIRHRGGRVYAFTRPGDAAGQDFARSLGCDWAGGSDQLPPQPLDAAIIFAPVGALVPVALRAVRKGGRVVCGGIHMSDIPSFPYRDLWGERSILSVANLTRRDGDEFLAVAAQCPIRTSVTTFALEHADQALDAIRSGRLEGAAVLLT